MDNEKNRKPHETTDESELHSENLNTSQGKPTESAEEEARASHETNESVKHDQEQQKPSQERTQDPKETAKRQSKKKKRGAKNGSNGLPSGSSKSVERAIAKKGKFGILGGLALGAGATLDFNSRLKDGDTAIEAAAGTAANAAVAYVVGPWLTVGAVAGKEFIEGAMDFGENLLNKSRDLNRLSTRSPFAQSRFVETRETFTMRQAAMSAIGQARGSVENAMIGNEASMFHR